MAKGLLPLVLRMSRLEPSLLRALALICDVAEECQDGTHVAVMPARKLAAMMGISENGARKIMDRLRLETTYLTRGAGQSAWVVTLPTARAIDDVVRCNWIALGGLAEHAPTIAKKWQVFRNPYPERRKSPVENPAIQGRLSKRETSPAGAEIAAKNRPAMAKKQAIQGRSKNAPYIGVNTQHSKSRAETANSRDTKTNARPERQPLTTSGGGLAGERLPDATQQDAAPDGQAPNVAGMKG
jgi:hypothetical protein